MRLTPNQVVQFFHQYCGGYLTIHDYYRIFAIASLYHTHQHPRCHEAKCENQQRCVDFDAIWLREQFKEFKDRSEAKEKICPWGLREVVLPITSPEGEVKGMVFWMPTTNFLDDQKRKPGIYEINFKVFPDTIVLALKILGAVLATIEHPPINCLPDQKKERILNFVKQYYRNPITCEDLAKELQLSPSRTRHLVLELYGCSFQSLLDQYRLEEAKFYLLHTDWSLSQIAGVCGFPSLRSFRYRFRKQFKITAQTYRKRYACKF